MAIVFVGLVFGAVILSLDIGPEEDISSPETTTAIAKTNDALGTHFAQTSTQLASMTASPSDMTNNSAVTATLTATSDAVEAVPVPPTHTPTASPE